jgi:hypothetical protein
MTDGEQDVSQKWTKSKKPPWDQGGYGFLCHGDGLSP